MDADPDRCSAGLPAVWTLVGLAPSEQACFLDHEDEYTVTCDAPQDATQRPAINPGLEHILSCTQSSDVLEEGHDIPQEPRNLLITPVLQCWAVTKVAQGRAYVMKQNGIEVVANPIRL